MGGGGRPGDLREEAWLWAQVCPVHMSQSRGQRSMDEARTCREDGSGLLCVSPGGSAELYRTPGPLLLGSGLDRAHPEDQVRPSAIQQPSPVPVTWGRWSHFTLLAEMGQLVESQALTSIRP